MISKYSLFDLMTAYNKEKEYIYAYINGDTIEGYNSDDRLILGMNLAFFLFLLILNLAIWVIALVLLIKYWTQIPDWAKVLGVIGVISAIGGPIMTILVVILSR